jgi:hypothetical protein
LAGENNKKPIAASATKIKRKIIKQDKMEADISYLGVNSEVIIS